MTKSPELVRRELQALRQAFVAQLPDRVRAIETALDEAAGAGAGGRQGMEELFQLAHRLSGAAGIYGCPTVQALAEAIERKAEGLRQGGDDPGSVAQLRQLVSALKRAATEAGESATPAE
jgi:HPt (histidine-containing phosphotransfer) domain-containing protein